MGAAPELSQPLKFEQDPFAAAGAGPHLGRPLQTAFSEIVRQIVSKTPTVLVTGGASTGKTLLVDMTARICGEMGLSLARIDRGDLMHRTLGERPDVLLVDEANSVEDFMLEAQARNETRGATTTIFLGLPSCAARFDASGIQTTVIELTALPIADARSYLLEMAQKAGLTDLFTSEALNLIVKGAQGSPRLLRSIASLAFFRAACDGAAQIGVRYAASALVAQQIPVAPDVPNDTPDAPEPLQANVPEPPLAAIEAPAAKLALPAFSAPVEPPVPLVTAAAASVYVMDQYRDEPSKLGRRTAIAAASLLAATAAVAAIVVSMPQTGYPARSLGTVSAANPVSASSPVMPALPPAAPEELTASPAPVMHQIETAEVRPSAIDAAQARANARRPLTDEEQAAVARGVQQLDLPATALRSSLNPH